MGELAWFYHLENPTPASWGLVPVGLSALARAGLPVLPGFVIGAGAVQRYILQPKLKQAVEKAWAEVSGVHDQVSAAHYAGLSKDIIALINKQDWPTETRPELNQFIIQVKSSLLLNADTPLRLSLTWCPTTPDHSNLLAVTGQVKSEKDFLKLWQKLLAQHFLPQALQYRVEEQGVIMPFNGSVMVQYHQIIEASGWGQCYDPEKIDGEVIYLEAFLHEQPQFGKAGTGEVYRYDRATLMPLTVEGKRHRFRYTKEGKLHQPKGRVFEGSAKVLAGAEQSQLARMIKRAQEIESLAECKIEWVLAHNQLFFSGVEYPSNPNSSNLELPVAPVLKGISANLGVIVGPVRILKTPADFAKLGMGEIAVVHQIKPDSLESLIMAGGIICEQGHASSLEAELAVRMGIPGVVGVRDAIKGLCNGQLITLDGSNGSIYLGRLKPTEAMQLKLGRSNGQVDQSITGTRLTTCLDDPLQVERDLVKNSDGIGLIRGEFLLHLVGHAPYQVIEKKREADYSEILTEILQRAAQAAYPNPVRYQFHDYWHSSELDETHPRTKRREPNGSLGYRGTHRLLQEPELLKVELKVIEKLQEEGLNNLQLVLPMVRQYEEAERMLANLHGWWEGKDSMPSVWVRCETPGLAIEAERLGELPVAGAIFDLESIAGLILGFDSGNYQVEHKVDQAATPVLEALKYAVSELRVAGKGSVLLSEDKDLAPEAVEAAVKAGLTEVCVHPSDLDTMRHLLAVSEQRMLLDHLVEEAVVSS